MTILSWAQVIRCHRAPWRTDTNVSVDCRAWAGKGDHPCFRCASLADPNISEEPFPGVPMLEVEAGQGEKGTPARLARKANGDLRTVARGKSTTT
jgi:hypothetical protein